MNNRRMFRCKSCGFIWVKYVAEGEPEPAELPEMQRFGMEYEKETAVGTHRQNENLITGQ